MPKISPDEAARLLARAWSKTTRKDKRDVAEQIKTILGATGRRAGRPPWKPAHADIRMYDQILYLVAVGEHRTIQAACIAWAAVHRPQASGRAIAPKVRLYEEMFNRIANIRDNIRRAKRQGRNWSPRR